MKKEFTKRLLYNLNSNVTCKILGKNITKIIPGKANKLTIKLVFKKSVNDNFLKKIIIK